MKMLYILNVANRVNNFCMSSLIAAKELNIEYHIAGNWGYQNDVEPVSYTHLYAANFTLYFWIRLFSGIG